MTRTDGRMVRGEFRPWQPPAPGRYCLAICYCGTCDPAKGWSSTSSR